MFWSSIKTYRQTLPAFALQTGEPMHRKAEELRSWQVLQNSASWYFNPSRNLSGLKRSQFTQGERTVTQAHDSSHRHTAQHTLQQSMELTSAWLAQGQGQCLRLCRCHQPDARTVHGSSGQQSHHTCTSALSFQPQSLSHAKRSQKLQKKWLHSRF